MITIVTGSQNSGKSTYMAAHYDAHRRGDGIVSVKVMDGNNVIGYNAYHLGDGTSCLWMVHERNYRGQFADSGAIGPYRYDKQVLARIDSDLKSRIDRGEHPIYLDEIGKLELRGHGFDGIMRHLMNSGLDGVISVRRALLTEVIAHYQIKDFNLIDVEVTPHV